MKDAQFVQRIRQRGSIPPLHVQYDSPELTNLVIQPNKIGKDYDAICDRFRELDKLVAKLIPEDEIDHVQSDSEEDFYDH